MTLERWLSGRKRQIANLLYGRQLRTEGSNPSLSVELATCTGTEIFKELVVNPCCNACGGE
jgi:hypothetical protein